MDIKTDKSFLVVGCGGLGCYIVEYLLRLNVKCITVCDPDTFCESNLNRQLYSTPKNLGQPKVEMAKKRAEELEFKGSFTAIQMEYSKEMLKGIDIVIDALDNIKSRLVLEEDCAKKNIPIIHGAVSGTTYQVGIVTPGSYLLRDIYSNANEAAMPKETFAFTASSCAAAQVALAVSDSAFDQSRLDLHDLL